jgi:hypothetical protein
VKLHYLISLLILPPDKIDYRRWPQGNEFKLKADATEARCIDITPSYHSSCVLINVLLGLLGAGSSAHVSLPVLPKLCRTSTRLRGALSFSMRASSP